VIREPRFGPRSAFQLKIYLRDIEPQIWRRVMVPGSMSLAKLHLVIQGAFDWDDCHLHEFEIYGKRYGMVGNDWDDDDELLDENEWRLYQLLKVHDRLTYLYDFGDHWVHVIEVEAAENVSRTLKKALCLDGARARPPEDVGGISGFTHFVEVMRNPRHEEYADVVQWHGERFKLESFSLLDTNGRIQSRS
jgi:hypothetical protein